MQAIKTFTFLLLTFVFSTAFAGTAPVAPSANTSPTPAINVTDASSSEAFDLRDRSDRIGKRHERRAKRLRRRSLRKATFKETINKVFPTSTAKVGADENLIIAVLLAIIIPPVGVWFWENSITLNFWIDLILLIGGFGLLGIVGLGAAAIFALIVIFLM